MTYIVINTYHHDKLFGVFEFATLFQLIITIGKTLFKPQHLVPICKCSKVGILVVSSMQRFLLYIVLFTDQMDKVLFTMPYLDEQTITVGFNPLNT